MQNFLFILESVAPVFLITFLGILLRKRKLIHDQFVHDSSQLVYKVALPVLVFVNLSNIKVNEVFNGRQISLAIIATTISFIFIWLMARPMIHRGRDRGTFVQGAFRSNYSIVGFAIIAGVFGEHALAKGAMILAFIMPLYNLLSIIVLTISGRKDKHIDWTHSLVNIMKNPLIIAAIISILFSLFRISVHPIIIKTGRYLAAMALPVALLGIGGSLNLEIIKKASKLAVSSSLIKLVLIPLIWTFVAIRLGFRGDDLGVLYVLFATPTAVASFVMAKSLGGNGKLAGNIVLISTLGASVTMTVGLFLLKAYGYV